MKTDILIPWMERRNSEETEDRMVLQGAGGMGEVKLRGDET